MRLIITRHGETIENSEGILMGQLHGTLSKKSIEEAKRLSIRLKEEHIDCIYSSDLKRAADTAKEIAKYHTSKLILTPDLRERYLGDFQGKKYLDLGFDLTKSSFFPEPPNGETAKQLLDRASKFYEKIFKENINDTVLIVAHNGINRALISVITEKNHTEMETIPNLKSTSISIFEINEKKEYEIETFDCIKHLD